MISRPSPNVPIDTNVVRCNVFHNTKEWLKDIDVVIPTLTGLTSARVFRFQKFKRLKSRQKKKIMEAQLDETCSQFNPDIERRKRRESAVRGVALPKDAATGDPDEDISRLNRQHTLIAAAMEKYQVEEGNHNLYVFI